MLYHGEFINKAGRVVDVEIRTSSGEGVMEIGTEDCGMWFQADDAVETQCNANDTFDVLITHDCTLRLVVTELNADLLALGGTDTTVRVTDGGKCVFYGYVKPMTFSQDFSSVLDDYDIECADALSVLDGISYKRIGHGGADYKQVRQQARNVTFKELLVDALCNVMPGGWRLLYDGSKRSGADASACSVLDETSVSELLFLGSDEDDVWKCSEILEELCRYLNLHIVQVGTDVYLFDWESVRNTGSLVWTDLLTGEEVSWNVTRKLLDIDNAADDSTSVSIGEVYNVIELTCDCESMGDVVESPLSDSSMVSPYLNKQLYVREMVADADDNKEARKAIKSMWNNGELTSYKDSHMADYYLQTWNNKNWTFYRNGLDVIKAHCYNGVSQHILPSLMGASHILAPDIKWDGTSYNVAKYRSAICAAIFGIGKVEKKGGADDNSVAGKVDMSKTLVVNIGGGFTSDGTGWPTEDDILAACPVAQYVGGMGGGTLAPSVPGVTNYIVISGSMVMNPLQTVCTDQRIFTDSQLDALKPCFKADSDKGWYRMLQYYTTDNPTHEADKSYTMAYGFEPFFDGGEKYYKFSYSAIGDRADHISKVSVLACMLIVGDKCVVETEDGSKPEQYKWVPYKTLEECGGDVDAYYQQCFTIGVNPKIGDCIVGTEFDIQNNITVAMGLDTEGTAIPIRYEDNISGRVEFKILGPVNMTWDNVTYRHKTFFRKGKWSSTSSYVLPKVSNIQIKGFEVKVYSDNGHISNGMDGELKYVSDTDETFLSKRDDLEMKICSGITEEEVAALGVSSTPTLNNAIGADGRPLLSVYDANRHLLDKPERLYVDAYYNEYHKPRLEMEHCVLDDGGCSGFIQYKHQAVDTPFFAIGISRNLHAGECTLKLKTISND